jgi:CRP-like cAMP-binding protein
MNSPIVREKITNFLKDFKEQKYNKKEIIIKPDDEPEVVYCILEGAVRMYAVSANGEELVINTFKPFAYFPMGWVLNDIVPRHYYEAMDPVVLKKVSKTAFLEFIQANPEVLMELTKRIYYGLEGYFTRMEYLMSGNASARLITELLILGKRFGVTGNNETVVSLKLTEKDLAALTGITRETVSRELNKLKIKGLVSLNKNILTVSDMGLLERELSPS